MEVMHEIHGCLAIVISIQEKSGASFIKLLRGRSTIFVRQQNQGFGLATKQMGRPG